MVNRKAREAKRSIKSKAFAAAGAAISGPGGAIAAKAGERLTRKTDRGDEDKAGSNARPEGRGLKNQRQQALTKARAEAHTKRTEGLHRDAHHRAEGDARIAATTGSAGHEQAQSGSTMGGGATGHAVVAIGATVWRRLDQSEAQNRRHERQARKQPLTAGVDQRWDGGTRSAIAPMKVYTPAHHREPKRATDTPTRESRHDALRRERAAGTVSSSSQVRNAPMSNTTPRDRYA